LVSVFIISLSPFLINKGTLSLKPVSSKTSLLAPATVLPFTASSAFVTLKITFGGIFIIIGLSSKKT